MSSLCERPGCSEIGATAYGMIPEDLLFWLAPIGEPVDGEAEQRVLCRRHADAMVVPRGWTLDDRRDADLHLFNTHRFDDPPKIDNERVKERSEGSPRRQRVEPDGQLQIDGTGEINRPERAVTEEPQGSDQTESSTDWRPHFDQGDDLDGLLKVDSPLLSRAFRGSSRPQK